MIVKKVKIQLLAIFTIAGNFCFGQDYGNPFLVFDTSEIKHLPLARLTYYENNVIASKLYYDSGRKKLHYEFIRLAKDKYYCSEFDSSGILINEGVAVKEAMPYEYMSTPVFDSLGNNTGIKKYPFYKLIKDEKWSERINAVSWMNGKYAAGKKAGVWTEIKNNGDVENRLHYKNGLLIKNEKINFANTGEPQIATLLVNKWIVIKPSQTPTQKFYPGGKMKNYRGVWYIWLLKDGSCKMFSGGWHHSGNSVKTGKWQTNKTFSLCWNLFLQIKP